MKKCFLVGFLCLFVTYVPAQVLRDIDYSSQYDPNAAFTFTYRIVKLSEGFKVFYDLTQADTTLNLGDISIQFETRESLGEKTGTSVSSPLAQRSGSVNFSVEANQIILVAKVQVSDLGKSKTFIYHKRLPIKKSPAIIHDNKGVTLPFITVNESVTFEGNPGESLQVSYYKLPFPAAAPAFSSTQTKVAKTVKPDSIFTITGSPLMLTKKGLYLAQQDTATAEGIAFRVENDYPKLSKLESLAGPLLYISTKQETEKLKQAGNDKKKFDQVILSITGNAERARTFMRNYFKRVESANIFFSSYKEGWKTDRGMIYIIFGPPNEAYIFDDREIWEYKSEDVRARFQFVKSPTLFDPENYVLIRDKKYTTTWYKVVDLWRKARF